MREFLVTLVGVAFVLGAVFVAQQFYERSYSPPARPAAPTAESPSVESVTSAAGVPGTATDQMMPLKCVVVISALDKQTGQAIPNLNVGNAGDLGLLRPVGEMIATELPLAASRFFQEVDVVSDEVQAVDADVIVDPAIWTFTGDTGYELTGPPLVFGAGEAFVSGHLGARVKLQDATTFEVSESVSKVTIKCGGAVPFAALRRIMTDATDRAIVAVSEKLMASVAGDPRVRERYITRDQRKRGSYQNPRQEEE